MKVYRVTGWVQFKTDAATFVNRVQIAKSAQEAIAMATFYYADRDDHRWKLVAAEVTE